MFTAKESRVVEAVMITTDCCTDEQVREYIDSMYYAGMTVEDVYTYFITNGPSCI